MENTFTSEVLTIEHDGNVGVLWLDRPEARNAMGEAFFSDLGPAMAVLSADRDVRAVVIAARGPHFSSGLDLKAMGSILMSTAGDTGGASGAGGAGGGGGAAGASGESGESSGTASDGKPSMAARTRSALSTIRRLQDAITAVAECPKPVIAAVHGFCLGGGVDLISACDLRLAASDATFSVRETKVAIVADLGSLQRLPHIIGAGHVAELAFTGKDIDAARAKDIGLVNDVFPDYDSLLDGARHLAGEIAANSPVAVQGTKAVLAAADRRSLAEGLDYVALWNAGMLASDDLVEAVTAFFEKRPPKFTGS
jgi:enoyl-CoA hydratase